MRYGPLGTTGLNVSRIGLGGWTFGGGYDWGPIEFKDIADTVNAALETGINLIDTAPVYGSSEEALGMALKGKRSHVILSTKCGLIKNGSWAEHNLKSATITKQLENSLKNLQTDVIDLYLIHYLDPATPWQEVLHTLQQLQTQGKIRYIGACNIPADVLTEMVKTGLISCVQDEFSLLHCQKAKQIVKICQDKKLGFISYGSLCGGILSGKYKKEPNLRRADARNYFYKCYRGQNFLNTRPVLQRLSNLAAKKGVSAAQIALAWLLHQPGITCALTGARNPQQIIQNAQAAQLAFSAEELCNLQK